MIHSDLDLLLFRYVRTFIDLKFRCASQDLLRYYEIYLFLSVTLLSFDFCQISFCY